MRRICNQAVMAFVFAGMTAAGQAGEASRQSVDILTVETPGLAPVQVFVGGAEEANRAADSHGKAQALQREAEHAARVLAAEPPIAAPDYPLQAPLIVVAPLVPVPDYPAPVAGFDRAPVPVVRADASGGEITAALRVILAKPEEYGHARLTRAQRDDIIAFYAARDFRPLWSDGRGLTASGASLHKALLSAGNDGLDAQAYQLERPTDGADAHALAAFDFRQAQVAVLYARDAQGGRIDAKRLSNLIDPEIVLASPSEVLAALVGSSTPGQTLENYNPPHPGYRALRAQLVRMRVANAAVPAAGPASVADDAGTPVPATRKRKTAVLAAASSPGEADIIANMERWRWLPRDLGEKHVFVNIPEYRVRVMERGVVAHEARAIVGKPDSQTPVFSDRMQFLVVNPSWFVPPSIMKKEFLPKLAQDPTYAERRGYQVIRRGSQIYVKQPPGERNALGHIKFMFPNRHAVYLHDTPSRGLFGAERRAFSHGCVRVDQPFRLAEFVLGADGGWTEQKVRGLVGRGEQSVKLSTPLPVHLTYFTTFVNDLGGLEKRDDIYGHNRRVKAALGLE